MAEKHFDSAGIERLKEAYEHLRKAHVILGQLGAPAEVAEKATRVPIYTVAMMLSQELGFELPRFG